MRSFVFTVPIVIVGLAGALLPACVGDSASGETSTTDDGGSPSNDGAAAGNGGDGGLASGGGDAAGTSDSGPAPCGTVNSACCAGNTCNGGAQCNGAICACPPAAQTACGTTCVDTQGDAKNCGRCGHDCLVGTCNAGKCSAFTVTSDALGNRLFTDGGRVYWTRDQSGPTHAGFFTAKLDGTDPQTVFDAGASYCKSAVAALGKAYFSCYNGATYDIRQCTLPCGAGSSTVLKGGIASMSAMTVNPATGTAYYAVPTTYNQAPAGGIFDIVGNRIGGATQANANDLIVANGSIYWLNSGTYLNDNVQLNGGVKRASLLSPSTETVVVTAGNTYYDNGTLAVDANNVYYVGQNYLQTGTDVVVANASGADSAPTVFVSKIAGGNVVSDGTNVFFLQSNAIRYCSRTAGCGAGANVKVLADEPGGALYLDTNAVMWVGSNGIRRIAKP